MTYLLGIVIDFFFLLTPLLITKLNTHKINKLEKTINYVFPIVVLGAIVVCFIQKSSLVWWGAWWWVGIYYLSCLLVLFLFLTKKKFFTPLKTATASFFTVYISSVVWELPNFFLWSWRIPFWMITQTLLFLLVIPVFWVFKLNSSGLKYFIPLLIGIILLDVVGGSPGLYSSLTLQHQIFGNISRVVALVGLTYIFWIKGTEHKS